MTRNDGHMHFGVCRGKEVSAAWERRINGDPAPSCQRTAARNSQTSHGGCVVESIARNERAEISQLGMLGALVGVGGAGR
ncbi:hypothetical protein OAS39_10920 [Pirellulales bacterium]|nr:hypothetical protein [Pirellulales bacterium]